LRSTADCCRPTLACARIGKQIEVLTARDSREIDEAFARLARERINGLVLLASNLFGSRRVQITTLATHHKIPTIYTGRDDAVAGGLMSYGANFTEQARLVGIYTGRVLKGEKPADLPVMQAAKFEFVINLQTAHTLGLTVPPTLLAIADEVIE
jgi:putative tryptophan/tyrosine transport system substrate-binding protein